MKRKIMSIILALAVVLNVFSINIVTVSAADDDIPALWQQAGVVSAANGNIARASDATVTREYANGNNTGVCDGVIPTSAGGNHWNTWGAGSAVGSQESPVYAQVEWAEPYVVEGTRVMWHIYTDAGVRWPNAANIQYRNSDGEWVNVFPYTPQPNSSSRTGVADPNSPIGVDGKSGTSDNRPWPAPSTWASNGIWNVVKFPAPITTTAVRLLVYGAKTSGSSPGIGVGEWEVFGSKNPVLVAVNNISDDYFANLSRNIDMPVAPEGMTYIWTIVSGTGLTNTGVVTRPPLGDPDYTGTIKVEATDGTQSAERTFNYNIVAEKTDTQSVELDKQWLELGDTTSVTTDLVLPLIGQYSSNITWSTDGSGYLLNDGTVIRPPSAPDATVILTATITKGTVTDTKEFIVGIPAYELGGRVISIIKTAPDGPIINSEEYVIQVPIRTAPKLPYRVWVEYTDGYGEWRNTQWPWSGSYGFGPAGAPGTEANIEQVWQGYPLDHEYTVTGWVTGDNATTWGYPITVNCKVVAGDFTMPQVNGIYRGGDSTFTTVAANPASLAVPEAKVAKTVPITNVSLDTTNPNRLTSNVTRSVTQAATATVWEVPRWIYNYRDSFGLPVGSGTDYSTQPTGWESPTTKLRGHGAGHYINALALTYNTGAGTENNRATILEKIKRFVKETREIQEMTFYPLDWVGKGVDGNPNNFADYEAVLDAGKTWKDLEVTKWREASDTWPYNAEDKAENAPDWPYITLDQVTSSWDGIANSTTRERNLNARDPKWFGYGYIHATQPMGIIVGERYGSYSAWLWAPYYSVHKQLAGFMDCYYTFKDSSDPELLEIAETAFAIARDMSHWISNRLTTKCFIGDRKVTTIINPKVPGNTTYGNMNYQWSTNISGEYGGVNESIARVAYELSESDPERELLIAGADMFYNKSYWDTLAANSEVMSLSGNSHANSRIPNFPGTLWQYTLNHDPYYYVVAKNHFDFNAGRFRYYGGNVGNGEWYRAPYTQIANLAGQINETCCAMNLAKLSKELACFDPDNAEYMDYLERLTFNQLIGSVRQSGGTWGVTYQYAVGPNENKSFGNTDPGSTCCGGTGVENPSRYIESAYLANDDTVWVNMMMPVKAVLNAPGYTIAQDCLWPAETSTITVTANEGQTQKAMSMKIRIPWWATKDVSITLNGVEVADKYLPSSFVEIPSRMWTSTDKVILNMPFQASIDYAPDRSESMWAGTIFYGPLAMAGTGNWSVLTINSDLGNISFNPPVDRADTASNTPGNNRNIYEGTVSGQTHSNADVLQPDYYRDTNATKYFRINLIGSTAVGDRALLFPKLQEALGYEPPENYSPDSYNNLLNAIASAIAVYQDEAATQAQVDAQVLLLQSAIDNLAPNAEGKTALFLLINEAAAREAVQNAWLANPDDTYIPYAPYGYARMLVKATEAKAVYNNDTALLSEVNAAYDALKYELDTMRIGNQYEVEDLDVIKALLAEADEVTKGMSIPEELASAIQWAEEAVEIITVGGSTMGEYPPALIEARLRAAIDAFLETGSEPLVNLWDGVDYAFFSGTSNSAIEGNSGTNSIGGTIDIWNWWEGSYYYVWRIVPDDKHEYFQIRRQTSAAAALGNSLAPTGGVVAGEVVLTLAAPSDTDDSQWWKFILQPNGRYIIVNKVDPTLCIALNGPLTSGTKLMLAPLTAENNTWRVCSPTGTTAPPDVPITKPILKVSTPSAITVPAGTAIGAISLPTVAVTYADNSVAVRNVTWDTTSYSSTQGTYTLTGTIALQGMETNPNDVKASVQIIVGAGTSTGGRFSLSAEIGTLVPNQPKNIEVTIKNETRDNPTAVVVAALYDKNGKFVTLKTLEVTVNKSETKTETITLNIPSEIDGLKVKIFTLANLKSIQPLSNAVTN